MKLMFFWMIVFSMNFVYAQNVKKVIKFKKETTIDLSSLNVDGKVLTPTELNLVDEQKKKSKFKYRRKNFRDRVKFTLLEAL